MSLGDSFPDSFKKDHASRNLRVGGVLKLKVLDANPPKEKRFIIVGITADGISLATVYINSEINRKCNYSRELLGLQHFFESAGRDYLDHDSYVDCSKIIPRDWSEIFQAVVKRPEAIIGQLSENDFSAIRNKIIGARTIKGKDKKKFGFYLNTF